MPKAEQAGVNSVLTADFRRWLSTHGVVAHGIQAAFVAEGWRGVVATGDIIAGTGLVAQSCESPSACNLISRRRCLAAASPGEGAAQHEQRLP